MAVKTAPEMTLIWTTVRAIIAPVCGQQIPLLLLMPEYGTDASRLTRRLLNTGWTPLRQPRRKHSWALRSTGPELAIATSEGEGFTVPAACHGTWLNWVIAAGGIRAAYNPHAHPGMHDDAILYSPTTVGADLPLITGEPR